MTDNQMLGDLLSGHAPPPLMKPRRFTADNLAAQMMQTFNEAVAFRHGQQPPLKDLPMHWRALLSKNPTATALAVHIMPNEYKIPLIFKELPVASALRGFKPPPHCSQTTTISSRTAAEKALPRLTIRAGPISHENDEVVLMMEDAINQCDKFYMTQVML